MIIRYLRTIHQSPVGRLDQVPQVGTGTGGDSNHTHANLPFLDRMNIDSNRRLTHSSQLIDVPLLSEDW